MTVRTAKIIIVILVAFIAVLAGLFFMPHATVSLY